MGMRFGQHFLKSEKLLKKIAEYAGVSKNDVVLEVGAGDGRLTKYLTNAKKVYAVEIDKILAEKIKEKNLENVKIVNKDILDFEFPNDVNKIVGNLPYQISSPVTEKILLFLNSQLRKGIKNLLAVLMYQREFAERMVAFPGLKGYSRLSVLVDYYANCELLRNVSRTMFRPVPKVESALVKLTPKDVLPSPKLFELAKLIFMHKNKKVINALVNSRRLLKEKDKLKLKKILPSLLGEFADKKVFYLGVDELQNIKDRIKEIL